MLFTLAIIPTIVLLVFIYKMDKKEKEPMKFLRALFGLGVFLIIPTFIVESVLDFIVSVISTDGSVFNALLTGFFVAALTEEGGKYIMLKTKSWNSKYFDCSFDGIVYAVFVSAGFATLENITYVIDGGIETAFLRMFTSVPGHVCFAVAMGYFYSKARMAINIGDVRGCKRYKRMAVLIPMLLHGIYDFLIMMDMEVAGEGLTTLAVLLWVLYVVLLFIMSFILVVSASESDDYITYNIEYWFCPCGNRCYNNFCSNCGHPSPMIAEQRR